MLEQLQGKDTEIRPPCFRLILQARDTPMFTRGFKISLVVAEPRGKESWNLG